MKIWNQQQEADNLSAKFEGINKAKFARDFNVPGGASMLSQHISGHRSISLGAAIAYAKGFGCALSDISQRLHLEIQNANFMDENTELAPRLAQHKKIGVVGTAQLGDDGYWAELDYPAGHGDGYVQHASKDIAAYALRCKGDSMKPRIKHGEYVIIEPSHPPINGDEVMVKCKQGRVMVKELLYIRDNLVHLGSVNESHAKITIPMQEVESIHYVAAIVKSGYWSPD